MSFWVTSAPGRHFRRPGHPVQEPSLSRWPGSGGRARPDCNTRLRGVVPTPATTPPAVVNPQLRQLRQLLPISAVPLSEESLSPCTARRGGQAVWVPLTLCSPAGPKPRVSENDFEDLLSNQGFSSRADRKGPRTIAEMRRQDQARDSDPLKLKVLGEGCNQLAAGSDVRTFVQHIAGRGLPSTFTALLKALG